MLELYGAAMLSPRHKFYFTLAVTRYRWCYKER